MIEGDFTSEELETIGGLVLEQLNRAPERGDRVEVDGYVVEVTSVEGTRISTVRVHEREEDDSGVD
jgi:CBS domain containing-hemolysin-like protein